MNSYLEKIITKIDNKISKDKIIKARSKNYDWIQLPDNVETVRTEVLENAQKIYADNWNYYSNALQKESIEVFWKSISHLNLQQSKCNYLEIGSAQGLSMSAIGLLIQNLKIDYTLTSLDPYFSTGYSEGERHPTGKKYEVKIDKVTRDKAKALYDSVNLKVNLIENNSFNGLTKLIQDNKKFDLIYIDGSHELLNPIIDFGLSFSLLSQGGIVMLDDHLWKDVKIIKTLCDLDPRCKKIHESWKIAAYQINKSI